MFAFPGASGSGRAHEYGSIVVDGQAHAQLGDNYVNQLAQYGHTVNHFCHNPAQTSVQARLQPSIVIPFPRNRDFVLRDEFLTLWKRRDDAGDRIALFGLGGIGKSSLAIEFAYRVHFERPDTWVFWVHAGSATRFEEGYRIIAESLQIPGRHEQRANIFILVKAWLCQRAHGPWVMIVDNADDEQLVLGREESVSSGSDASSIVPLCHHLPSASHGLLLFTTRNITVAHGLVEYETNVISLGPMNEEVALQLLEKKLGTMTKTCTTVDLGLLAEQLDYIPLAMTQAVAYIRHRSPRMNVPKYVSMLQGGDTKRGEVLEAVMRDPWREGPASNSVIMTWHHSYEHIQLTQEPATRLLSLMSQFDRNGIPEFLLKGHYLSSDAALNDQEDSFDNDVAVLKQFDLIDVSTNGKVFSIHRIVQFATKRWLDHKNETGWWQRRSFEILDEYLPDEDVVTWYHHGQILYPHVSAVRLARLVEKGNEEVYAKVLLKAFEYAEEAGLHDQAEEMIHQSLNIFSELCGPVARWTLRAKHGVCTMLYNRANYNESELLFKETFEMCDHELGKNDQLTWESMAGIACALMMQQRFKEAEEMDRHALAGLEHCIGVDHPSTLRALNNLGFVLAQQGMFSEAEETIRSGLRRSAAVYGRDSLNILWFECNLGSILDLQNKHDEAENLHRQTLIRSRNVFGELSPQTSALYEALAESCLVQGKWAEALDNYSCALTGFEAQMGADHPRTSLCRSNIEKAKEYLKNQSNA